MRSKQNSQGGRKEEEWKERKRENERGREEQRLVSEAAAAAAGVAGLQLLRPLDSESFINLAYDKLCLGQQLEPKSTDNCAASAIPLSPFVLSYSLRLCLGQKLRLTATPTLSADLTKFSARHVQKLRSGGEERPTTWPRGGGAQGQREEHGARGTGYGVAVLRTRCVNRRQVALWRIKKICTSVTLAGHSSETQAAFRGGERGLAWHG